VRGRVSKWTRSGERAHECSPMDVRAGGAVVDVADAFGGIPVLRKIFVGGPRFGPGSSGLLSSRSLHLSHPHARTLRYQSRLTLPFVPHRTRRHVCSIRLSCVEDTQRLDPDSKIIHPIAIAISTTRTRLRHQSNLAYLSFLRYSNNFASGSSVSFPFFY